jgi:hypothetical protein
MILDHIKSGTVDFERIMDDNLAKRAKRERRSWHSTMLKVKGRTNPSAQSKVAMGTIRKLIAQNSKQKRQRRSAVDVARRGLTRRIARNAIRTRLLSGGSCWFQRQSRIGKLWEGFCLSSTLEPQSDRAISCVAPDSFSDNSAKSLNDGDLVEEALSEKWVKPQTILVGPGWLHQHGRITTIKASCAQSESDGQLSILFERDMWIADTGASNHGTFLDIGGRNVQATESSNLGFSGEAQKVQKLMDIPVQFVTQDGSMGLRAVLTGVGHTALSHKVDAEQVENHSWR